MKLRFYFERIEWADEVNVYLTGEDDKCRRFIAQPMQIVFEPLPESSATEPTIRFNGQAAREFFPALVQGLAESGYKYEHKDQGKLEAMGEHLKDLQKVLNRFLENKT